MCNSTWFTFGFKCVLLLNPDFSLYCYYTTKLIFGTIGIAGYCKLLIFRRTVEKKEAVYHTSDSSLFIVSKSLCLHRCKARVYELPRYSGKLSSSSLLGSRFSFPNLSYLRNGVTDSRRWTNGRFSSELVILSRDLFPARNRMSSTENALHAFYRCMCSFLRLATRRLESFKVIVKSKIMTICGTVLLVWWVLYVCLKLRVTQLRNRYTSYFFTLT